MSKPETNGNNQGNTNMTQYQFSIRDYAGDGFCHNANRGTYGHECGKPAEYIGTNDNAFRTGFCAHCAKHGDEASNYRLQLIKSREQDAKYAYIICH